MTREEFRNSLAAGWAKEAFAMLAMGLFILGMVMWAMGLAT